MPDSSVNPNGSTTSGTSGLQRALSLVGKGYYIFPAFVARRPDGTKDVRPVRDWDAASSTSVADAHEWFGPGAEWESADVCIDCGRSGIVVVDLDEREGDPESGGQNWAAVRGGPERGFRAGGAWTLNTPGGGRHLYFRQDPQELIGSRNGAWPHVDVKGVGGLVFAYGFVPKVSELPRRPDILTSRVKVVGGAGGAGARSRALGGSSATGPEKPTTGRSPGGFELPSMAPREFSDAQAAEFCSAAMTELGAAPRGQINERLNEAAVTLSHFVPEFWSERDVTSWLLEQQRVAWVAAGGADDGNYDAAAATIRSGLGAVGWRARRRADSALTWDSHASQASGENSQPPPEDAVSALIAEMLTPEGLAALPAPVPLVDGWLFRDTVARLNGRPGGGKSLLALDLAASVGTGRTWRRHSVRQGEVIYVVAEGASGQLQRVRAWEHWNEQKVSGVRFLPRPVQVADRDGWGVLVAACERIRPALIVLDTQARITEGLEENSAKEMGLLVGAAERLRAASGACVLLVHHVGHGGDRGRGSSAVNGAVGTELVLDTEDERGPKGQLLHRWRDLRFGKQKDGDDTASIRMELHIVGTAGELGTDADGRPVTSAVLEGGDGFQTPGVARWLSDADLDGNAARLADLMGEVFTEGKGGTKAEVRNLVKQRELMSDAGFYRAWNRLIEGGRMIRVTGTQSYLWIAEGDENSHENFSGEDHLDDVRNER
jgi:hypothetical protein